MPQKLTCIIDASSCNYLSRCQINTGAGKTLLELLSNQVVFRFSSKVHTEVNAGRRQPLVSNAQVYPINKSKMDEYEQSLFGNVAQISKDKGEKHNFAVMLDLFLEKKQRGLIFLIDDISAKRNIFSNLFPAFPIALIWSSLDVVLFLYLLNGRSNNAEKTFSYEVAQTALNDLNSALATDDPRMKEEKTRERQETIKRYREHLDRIKAIVEP
ncbi:MAG: hypothetical protein SNJ55_05000 [Chloroherpetonaceae bacterium]